MILVVSGIFFAGYIQAQSLSDKVAGEFKGRLKNQSSDLNDYKIKITKISDTKVKVQPLTGTQSQTFIAELTESQMGSITVIKFKLPSDHLMNNGMYVDSNKRLSYSIFLGGDDDRNIEIFSGSKI